MNVPFRPQANSRPSGPKVMNLMLSIWLVGNGILFLLLMNLLSGSAVSTYDMLPSNEPIQRRWLLPGVRQYMRSPFMPKRASDFLYAFGRNAGFKAMSGAVFSNTPPPLVPIQMCPCPSSVMLYAGYGRLQSAICIRLLLRRWILPSLVPAYIMPSRVWVTALTLFAWDGALPLLSKLSSLNPLSFLDALPMPPQLPENQILSCLSRKAAWMLFSASQPPGSRAS